MNDTSPTIDDLVSANMKLARSLAAKCQGKGVDDDALESEAMLALLKAAQRFDTEKFQAAGFRPWARLWIVRALKRTVANAPLNQLVEVPPCVRKQALQCLSAVGCLSARGIRRPSVEQIAGEALLDLDTVWLIVAIPGLLHRQPLVEWCESHVSELKAGEPSLTPMFGVQTFTPHSECPHFGRIEKGSSLCCMICHASGMDGHPALKRDRRRDPKPEPSRAAPPKAKPASKESRKEKRLRLFGPLVNATPPTTEDTSRA